MVPERSPICLLRVYQVSKEVLLSPRYISAVFMKEQLIGNVDSMSDHLGLVIFDGSIYSGLKVYQASKQVYNWKISCIYEGAAKMSMEKGVLPR